jgi:hypothetical protein
MPRKRTARQLPPLAKGPAFRDKEHKTERLLMLLRSVAVANQREQLQLFYPLREVARSFKLPVSLVARVYRELEGEGFLKAIRGSATMLRGLRSTRKLAVRGIVAIPASVSCFVTMQDYRSFLIQIHKELRRHDFATADVPFVATDTASDLADRLKACHADQIIWYCPNKFANDIALRFGDMGIPIIGISDGGLPGIRCDYEINRDTAIVEIIHSWKARGIDTTTIASGTRRSAADEERIGRTLEDLDIEIKFVSLGSQNVDHFVESLDCDPNSGSVLLNSAASVLALGAPEALAKLAKRCATALYDGPVSTPFAQLASIPVDIVLVNWEAVAKRIVEDLLAQKMHHRYQPFVFRAAAVSRVPLNQYAQRL